MGSLALPGDTPPFARVAAHRRGFALASRRFAGVFSREHAVRTARFRAEPTKNSRCFDAAPNRIRLC
jgi:hypothetical protein